MSVDKEHTNLQYTFNLFANSIMCRGFIILGAREMDCKYLPYIEADTNREKDIYQRHCVDLGWQQQ